MLELAQLLDFIHYPKAGIPKATCTITKGYNILLKNRTMSSFKMKIYRLVHIFTADTHYLMGRNCYYNTIA